MPEKMNMKGVQCTLSAADPSAMLGDVKQLGLNIDTGKLPAAEAADENLCSILQMIKRIPPFDFQSISGYDNLRITIKLAEE